ncbi:MAG: hypothetical protein H6667_20535 [Ardenticatenaceae bacterium]|nr:hypothetical protein [Ardenticatenaceae bacterium]
MTRKQLYSIVGGIHLVFGFGFLLLPGIVVALYGISLDESGTLMAQLLGASDLASAALLLTLRDIPSSQAARVVSTKGALEWSLITIILLLYSVTGLLNFMGWVSVVLFAAIAFLFARDVFKQQDEATAVS